MCLLLIYISSLRNVYSNLLRISKIWLVVVLFLNCKSSLYILDIIPLLDMIFTYFLQLVTFFFFFWQYCGSNLGFVLVGQALYHLSHSASPKFGFFETGSHYIFLCWSGIHCVVQAGLELTFLLPQSFLSTGIISGHYHTCL
jgi:hypothetical protein